MAFFGQQNPLINPNLEWDEVQQKWVPRGTAKKNPSPLENQYRTYETAVEKQAGDYDRIQSGLEGILSNLGSRTATTPQLVNYQPSEQLMAAISNLGNLSSTGGYSADDLYNLRERSYSPIRAVYANAMRELNRNRALQGGYSPSYNATAAKMARELSSSIGDQTVNINAAIADAVAKNRASLAPSYASAAANADQFKAGIESQNADRVNSFANQDLESERLKLQALGAMSGLYGTTPALTATFGNQALAGAGLQNSINQTNENRTAAQTSNILNNVRSGYGYSNTNPLRRIYGA